MHYRVLCSFKDTPLSRGRIRRLLNALITRIIQNMKDKKAYVTGKTAENIWVDRSGGRIRLLVPDYFPTLEVGRKAGPIPKNFDKIIKAWMLAKGMRYVESKAESVAWSIYWYGSRRKQPFRDIYTGEMKKWERRNANFINNHDYYRYLRQNTDNN